MFGQNSSRLQPMPFRIIRLDWRSGRNVYELLILNQTVDLNKAVEPND